MRTAFETHPKIPASLGNVTIYFSQKGMSEQEAKEFFCAYKRRRRTSPGISYASSWKAIAYKWIARSLKHQPILFNRHNH